MFYFLLTLIAIAILLLSEAGQKLLIILVIVTLVLGGLFVVLVFLTGGISFLYSNKASIYNTYQKFGLIIPISLLFFGLYKAYKANKKRGLKKSIASLIYRAFPQDNEFIKYKKTIAFLMASFAFIVFVTIYLIFT